ncbi:hypothetical protein D3C80_1178160 [compost metagenome]
MQHYVAAEEGEGVDFVVTHQIEMEWRTHRIGACHQPVAQLVNILSQQRVIDQRCAGTKLTHVKIPHGHFLANA